MPASGASTFCLKLFSASQGACLANPLLSPIRSCKRHPALLTRQTKMTTPTRRNLMALRQFGAAAGNGCCACARNPCLCGHRDPVVACDDRPEQRRGGQTRQRFQCVAERLQDRPDLQGRLRRYAQRRDRRLPGRQCPRHHAGVRGRHRDHDGGQGCRQTGVRTDEGRGREIRSEILPAGDHRLLLDLEGRDAVVSPSIRRAW